MELGFGFLTTAASSAASAAAPYAKTLGSKIWGESEESGAVSKKDQHRCPLLCFLEISFLPLEDPDILHGMKIDFHKTTIDRCPASPLGGAIRWFKGQGRDKAASLVDDAVRAARWYDPMEDSEFGESVKFVYQKTIEGLDLYVRVYLKYRDTKSDLAIKSVLTAQKILKLALGESDEKVDEEDDEESPIESASGMAYYGNYHTHFTRRDLQLLIKQQEAEEEETHKSGLWTTDSKSFWVTRESGDIVVDELTPLVRKLRNLYTMHEKIYKERKHKQYASKFETGKEEYESILKSKKSKYWEKMH